MNGYEVATGEGKTLSNAILRLEIEVKRLTNQGYTYQGGISIAVRDNGRNIGYIVCQAMKIKL